MSKIIFLVVIVVSSKVPYTLTASQIENNMLFPQVKKSIDAFNNRQNNEQRFIDWNVFFQTKQTSKTWDSIHANDTASICTDLHLYL